MAFLILFIGKWMFADPSFPMKELLCEGPDLQFVSSFCLVPFLLSLSNYRTPKLLGIEVANAPVSAMSSMLV